MSLTRMKKLYYHLECDPYSLIYHYNQKMDSFLAAVNVFVFKIQVSVIIISD
jgi:hypothetical protein